MALVSMYSFFLQMLTLYNILILTRTLYCLNFEVRFLATLLQGTENNRKLLLKWARNSH